MKNKIFSAVFFLVFSAFAYLQFNDPDPIFWISIYGLTAIAALLNVFAIGHRHVFLGMMVVLVIISMFYIPGFVEYLIQPNKNEIVGEMVYKKPYIEQTREFLGLWIAAGALFHLWKMGSR